MKNNFYKYLFLLLICFLSKNAYGKELYINALQIDVDKEKKGLVETLKNILIQKPPFGNPINIEEYINKINSNSEKEHVRRIIGLRKDEVTFQENEPKKIILHIINNTREMVIRSLSKYFMGPGYSYDYIDDISPILIYYQHIVINEVQVQEEVKNKLKYIPDLHKVFIFICTLIYNYTFFN